jgi:hypothetical protein
LTLVAVSLIVAEDKGKKQKMKTQFKNHIKFGSCWYDNFFKVQRSQNVRTIETRSATTVSSGDYPTKKGESYREQIEKENSSI